MVYRFEVVMDDHGVESRFCMINHPGTSMIRLEECRSVSPMLLKNVKFERRIIGFLFQKQQILNFLCRSVVRDYRRMIDLE